MLKKTLSAVALCLTLGAAASAQDTGSAIKPAAGEITAEVQLNLSGDNTIGLQLNQLRGRYFLSPTTAIRASVVLNVEKNSDVVNAGNSTIDVSNSRTFVRIAPGIEKHFTGTERLSPYVGGEVTISKLFASQTTPTAEITGTNGNERAYLGFGLGAVAGADYYIAKHVYLGVEFGFGLEYRAEGDVETKPVSGPSSTNEGDGRSFYLSPSINSGLRLGFVF